MSTKRIPDVTIAGAGLAGTLAAIYLAKRGLKVDVYERRPDLRRENIPAGRSINLAISVRGIHPLKELGIDKEVLKDAIPMKGRMMHSREGQLTFQPYSIHPGEHINALSRGLLNRELLTQAERYPEVKIHFNQRTEQVDFRKNQMLVVDERTGATESVGFNRVIGTDGAFSAVRNELIKTPRINYSQTYLEHSYKELTIHPGTNGTFKMDKDALHIWPRKSFMMIALPNSDGSFTVTLFLSHEGPVSFASLDTKDKVKDFFEEQFPDAISLMPHFADEFFTNPTGQLMTVRCSPYHYEDKALILGDAAHAVVPFFGQGMNCAFEGVWYLDQCLGRYGQDWGKVFAEVSKGRVEDSQAIASLALENFIEMRDLVGDAEFLKKKAIERMLSEKYPEAYVSRYALVSFRRVPYSFAVKVGKVQDRILEELSRESSTPAALNWNKADQLVREQLKPLMNSAREVGLI